MQLSHMPADEHGLEGSTPWFDTGMSIMCTVAAPVAWKGSEVAPKLCARSAPQCDFPLCHSADDAGCCSLRAARLHPARPDAVQLSAAACLRLMLFRCLQLLATGLSQGS